VTHTEFVKAYASAEVRVEIDPQAAARFLSARLLLPFVTMPVVGAGVALVLIGWPVTGLALIVLGFVAPRVIKRTAPRFLLNDALGDPRLYEELTRTNVLRVENLERVTSDRR
jgi:hypothetical protein